MCLERYFFAFFVTFSCLVYCFIFFYFLFFLLVTSFFWIGPVILRKQKVERMIEEEKFIKTQMR